jgi:hypothetical protein
MNEEEAFDRLAERRLKAGAVRLSNTPHLLLLCSVCKGVEEEVGEPAALGSLFTHTEEPKAPPDALNDEARRRAQGLGA